MSKKHRTAKRAPEETEVQPPEPVEVPVSEVPEKPKEKDGARPPKGTPATSW